ncbi:testis-expressed protein 48 isoform X2 [Prionailurus viverrinus]|uniref:testis-expressed protein 48 isoform X2 n=1 Tax=Prionailurus viverrinus TaxID=61388 RepID=UPI001FF2F6D8|nr:testis-expressed protein 48 isoform X2 [Prionailurus viverrinus]
MFCPFLAQPSSRRFHRRHQDFCSSAAMDVMAESMASWTEGRINHWRKGRQTSPLLPDIVVQANPQHSLVPWLCDITASSLLCQLQETALPRELGSNSRLADSTRRPYRRSWQSKGFNFFSMAAHQNLASKIFCLCCKDCEDPQAMDDPKAPSEPQDQQPSTCSLQKEGLDSKNSKHANEASHSPLGQPLIHPEKRASTTSNNEYEELNTHVSQRGFCKRNLNRYSRDRWSFQPCHIGRP